MHRRLSVFFALATVVACDHKADVAPLDHDASMVRATPAKAPVPGERVDELLGQAKDAIAAGDTATAEGTLAGAVTVADTDAALVARVADRSLALGLAAYAELGYRRYLALAPRGPVAEQARERLALLAPETLASSGGIRAAGTPAAPPSAMRGAPNAKPLARSIRRASSRAPRRTPVRVAAAAPARRRARPASVSTGDVTRPDCVPPTKAAPVAQPGGVGAASDAPSTVQSVVPDPPAAATVAAGPAPRPRRSSVGRGAAVGAASGAVLGAVLGGGARGGLVGMVAGGVLGAAVGGRGMR